MTRLEKIKKEHIKKVNELLDKGHKDNTVKEETIELQSSGNVTSSSKEFINKMSRLNSINKEV